MSDKPSLPCIPWFHRRFCFLFLTIQLGYKIKNTGTTYRRGITLHTLIYNGRTWHFLAAWGEKNRHSPHQRAQRVWACRRNAARVKPPMLQCWVDISLCDEKSTPIVGGMGVGGCKTEVRGEVRWGGQGVVTLRTNQHLSILSAEQVKCCSRKPGNLGSVKCVSQQGTFVNVSHDKILCIH